MDNVAAVLSYCLVSTIFVYAVPPEACFAKFRWDDCGQPPTPVMYYYHAGSRCEVAIWRGCYPNPNMFADEYECINTCIFVTRGGVMDALDVLKPEDEVPIDVEETTTEADVAGNGTTIANSTEGNSTDVSSGNSTNAAPSGGNETTVAGGAATATETAAPAPAR